MSKTDGLEQIYTLDFEIQPEKDATSEERKKKILVTKRVDDNKRLVMNLRREETKAQCQEIMGVF